MHTRLIAAFALFVSGAGTSAAQRPIAHDTAALPQVTVTATRNPASILTTPLAITKVTAADPQLNGIIYQLLGRDLAMKMRRANTRRVLKEEEDAIRV